VDVFRGLLISRLIIRGLVLIGVDAVVLGLPRALMGFYSFMVLSSIGIGVIAAAVLRNVSAKVLLAAALGVRAPSAARCICTIGQL
jgi:hypothetical protein